MCTGCASCSATIGSRARMGATCCGLRPGELDVDEFEQLVARAGEATEAGAHRAATAALEQALGLCRGPPWAELDGDPSALGDAHRMDELRIGATEAMLEGRLALGIGAELVPELERLHRENPLRERPLAGLMFALYRAGRQTEALCELSRALRRCYARNWASSRASLCGSSSGRSCARTRRCRRPRRGREYTAASRLPVPATPFLGRARELAEVTALLRGAGGRLVTLTGAGGSGKTRLALQVAQTSAAEYRGGACFVGFADVDRSGVDRAR